MRQYNYRWVHWRQWRNRNNFGKREFGAIKKNNKMESKITFQYLSKSGFTFSVNPDIINDIEKLINEITTEMNAKKAEGKFICYISVPISPMGGGDFRTNNEIAAFIERNVTSIFGQDLWILNPAKYNLPKSAGGGDYMAIWSDILAGNNGNGEDLDMIYFIGPSDVWSFFGVSESDRIGNIRDWLKEKSKSDEHYNQIFNDEKRLRLFLRYYAIRGSAAYSKGAHDEWNIIASLNLKRSIGDDIAVYFNGSPIEPGDFDDSTDYGYQTNFQL